MSELVRFLTKHEIESASIETLKNEFSKTLQVTSEYLVYMSLIWKALSDKGVDLSGLNKGLMEYIPLIAMKKLDARFVVDHAGNRTLLSALSRLPFEEQHKLAETNAVTVVRNQDGNDTIMTIELSKMSLKDVHQVFDVDKGIRTVDEQKLWIKAKSKVQRKPKSTNRKNYRQIEFDESNEYLLLGDDAKVKIESVLTALGDLYEIDMFKVMSNYSRKISAK